MEIKDALEAGSTLLLHGAAAAAFGYIGAHYVVSYNAIKAAKVCALAGVIGRLVHPSIQSLTKSYGDHTKTVGKLLQHTAGFLTAWALYSYYGGVTVPYKAAAVLLGAVAISAEAVNLLNKGI